MEALPGQQRRNIDERSDQEQYPGYNHQLPSTAVSHCEDDRVVVHLPPCSLNPDTREPINQTDSRQPQYGGRREPG